MRRLLALVLLVGLGLTGCATSADARLRSRSEREPQPAAAAPVVGRVTVHVPAHASTVGVVVLHSFGHTEDEAVAQGWSAASDRHHFVAIYPYRSGSWNAGLCCGDAVEERRDDVAWLAATIEDARGATGSHRSTSPGSATAG